jgi:hypothetical protein
MKVSDTAAPARALVQPRLVGGSQPLLAYKRHEDARAAEARCLYYNGISFNVVDSDAWQEMIDAVKAAGPTYKSISRNALATTALEKEVASVNKDVKKILTTTKPTVVESCL